MRWVIVTTEKWGVFVGKLESYDPATRHATLADGRFVRRFGTKFGVNQLAATGPTADSVLWSVSPRMRISLVTMVGECTEEAASQFQGRLSE